MAEYIERFDSLTAYAEHIKQADAAAGFRLQADKPKDRSWDMGADFEEALEMALDGGRWDEGAAQLQSVSVQEAAYQLADCISPDIINDVSGGAVDIGAYLSNDPECFFRLDDEQEHIRPVVKIGVCNVPRSDITAGQLMNRGRGILALIEALELQGYSTELCSMFIAKKGDKVYRAEVMVKNAGVPWDAASVAYSIAHAAFSRRLGFRMLELHPNCKFMAEGGGYGRGDIKKPPEFDIYFDYLESGSSVSTPDRALEYVKGVARKYAPEFIVD